MARLGFVGLLLLVGVADLRRDGAAAGPARTPAARSDASDEAVDRDSFEAMKALFAQVL